MSLRVKPVAAYVSNIGFVRARFAQNFRRGEFGRVRVRLRGSAFDFFFETTVAENLKVSVQVRRQVAW